MRRFTLGDMCIICASDPMGETKSAGGESCPDGRVGSVKVEASVYAYAVVLSPTVLNTKVVGGADGSVPTFASCRIRS